MLVAWMRQRCYVAFQSRTVSTDLALLSKEVQDVSPMWQSVTRIFVLSTVRQLTLSSSLAHDDFSSSHLLQVVGTSFIWACSVSTWKSGLLYALGISSPRANPSWLLR